MNDLLDNSPFEKYGLVRMMAWPLTRITNERGETAPRLQTERQNEAICSQLEIYVPTLSEGAEAIYRKGFLIVRESMVCPCWRSSEKSVLAEPAIAEATTKLS